jgi:hypothetical protein
MAQERASKGTATLLLIAPPPHLASLLFFLFVIWSLMKLFLYAG